MGKDQNVQTNRLNLHVFQSFFGSWNETIIFNTICEEWIPIWEIVGKIRSQM